VKVNKTHKYGEKNDKLIKAHLNSFLHESIQKTFGIFSVQTVINFGMEIIKPKPYDGQWLEAAKRNDSQSCTDLCKTKSKCEVYNFNETTQECVMSIKGALSDTGP
jgi:hypothetical protein